MTLAFQLSVFALIATSSILLISVPIVFASPDGWSSTSLWIGLVFLVNPSPLVPIGSRGEKALHLGINNTKTLL
ncbi:Photosystem II PsbZ, reaction centre [Cynara cardunculus var. scolymus]|uniref:Photosystem II reaction center protein Z n=1 Tax=Cynara cardunculus var. scolymus TaxID=59895 RepID=A0A118K2H6_CYNCS|nr:Photosystem II PsbZ, reaction centre [Cynara cardunculus var. scolymus]